MHVFYTAESTDSIGIPGRKTFAFDVSKEEIQEFDTVEEVSDFLMEIAENDFIEHHIFNFTFPNNILKEIQLILNEKE